MASGLTPSLPRGLMVTLHPQHPFQVAAATATSGNQVTNASDTATSPAGKLPCLADRPQVSQPLAKLGDVGVTGVPGVEDAPQLLADHDQMWHRLALRL